MFVDIKCERALKTFVTVLALLDNCFVENIDDFFMYVVYRQGVDPYVKVVEF